MWAKTMARFSSHRWNTEYRQCACVIENVGIHECLDMSLMHVYVWSNLSQAQRTVEYVVVPFCHFNVQDSKAECVHPDMTVTDTSGFEWVHFLLLSSEKHLEGAWGWQKVVMYFLPVPFSFSLTSRKPLMHFPFKKAHILVKLNVHNIHYIALGLPHSASVSNTVEHDLMAAFYIH